MFLQHKVQTGEGEDEFQMLKIIFWDVSRRSRGPAPAAGRASENCFHSGFRALMDVAVASLVFRTWPVISCDLEIQMFPRADVATRKMNLTKMHTGTFFNFSFFKRDAR